jgi:hypothetical protein
MKKTSIMINQNIKAAAGKIVFMVMMFLTLVNNKTTAQGGEFVFNGKGQPFLRVPPVDVDGDPYLYDRWLPGKVLTVSGKVYENLKIKYDIYSDFLLFAYDSADEPLKFADDVKSFTLILSEPQVFYNGFPAIDNQTSQSYYQVLSKGAIMLLKRATKVINESKGYNTNVITKSYQNHNKYYIYSDGKISSTDNPKKALYSLAVNRKAQLDEFVKNNSINFKKDEDLSKVFNFYNNL